METKFELLAPAPTPIFASLKYGLKKKKKKTNKNKPKKLFDSIPKRRRKNLCRYCGPY
jgi:hypothetical protein